MAQTNREVARALAELAALTELEEGSPQAFRVRAYRNAARAIEDLEADIASMSATELVRVRGVGSGIARKIGEYLETGSIRQLERLKGEYPMGFVELSRIPGLGPKKLALLRRELGVETVDDLRAAIDQQRVREVAGLGAKTEENLARNIERLGLTGKEQRTPIARAMLLAEEIVTFLGNLPEVEVVEFAGSLRRFRETIGDLDVVAASARPRRVMDRFCGMALAAKVLVRGERKSSVLTHTGMQVDLRVVRPSQYGAALLYSTGSAGHNVHLRQLAIARGWTLNEYALAEAESGRVIASASEEEIYRALGLRPIPAPLREDSGEIEASRRGKLPRPAGLEDLRGDLHDHTDLSGDGRVGLESLVEAAARRGLAYLAITDHAEGLSINGVPREAMLEQRGRITRLAEHYPDLRILHGAELNIGPDGELDYDARFLAGYDWCVASVHSHFRLDPDQETRRIVKAMEHPAVNAIGHLTGRRIGRRLGIELDVEKVLEAAARTGTALEINSNLDRLDAPAEVLRRGRGMGVTFVISSDAHTVRELDNLRYGVLHAQRGWVDRESVANTWEPERFLAWARSKRDVGPS